MNKLALTPRNRYNKAAESGASTPPPGLTKPAKGGLNMALPKGTPARPRKQSRTSEELKATQAAVLELLERVTQLEDKILPGLPRKVVFRRPAIIRRAAR